MAVETSSFGVDLPLEAEAEVSSLVSVVCARPLLLVPILCGEVVLTWIV